MPTKRGILLIGFIYLLSLSTIQADNLGIEARLEAMTLEQKVAQMFMVGFHGTQLTEIETDFLQDVQPGAVVLFGKNIESPEQVTHLTNSYQQAILSGDGIPLFIAVDQEGGRIQHLQEGFTRFPLPSLWTATQNTDIAYQVGEAMATEMRAVGVNMNLAPVADLNTNIDNPIIGRRSFGSQAELVNPILTDFIRGLQDNGVMATVKHFPGHGDTSSDSHVELPIIEHTRDRLDSVEFLPFVSAIDVGVDVTMVSHIWFTALDNEQIPASLSRNIVTRLLRDEMDYDGIIMTDALDMDAIDTVYTVGGSAIQAILAGNDLIAIGAHVGTQTIEVAISDVIDAVKDGRIAESRIDASVMRILMAKEKYGVFVWQSLDPFTVANRLNLEAHDRLVTELFAQGVTVVGDANDVIPLQGNVAIIYPATRPTISTECSGIDGNIKYTGVSDSPSDEEISWAMTASMDADTVIVFTQNAISNARQQALVQAMAQNKTIIVALWDTSDMIVFPDVMGYVLGYSPMLRTTSIICDILFGRLPANGTLPIVYKN
jgi:beta-N-acetylhexosaminidase